MWTGVLTPVNMHDGAAGTSFRDAVVSSIAGLCAGSLLAMVAATMLPAAYERAGRQSVCFPPCLPCPEWVHFALLNQCVWLPTSRLWACLHHVGLLH